MQTASNAVEAASVNVIPFPKRERCVIIPAETLYAVGQREISPGAKWLYTILRSHTNAKGECRAYLETLAEESGQTARTVRRQLLELREADLLVRERNGRSRANDFTVDMNPGIQAKNDLLSGKEKEGKTGRILSENRPELVQKQAKNGLSYKEQIAEQEVEQASSARQIDDPFQKFSFAKECKKAFHLHRKKNTLTRFLEILEELEKRNQPTVFYRALEKYLLKGENGDIYPATILRDYLWKEMAQEAEFDRQEEILEEKEREEEEAEQQRWEEVFEQAEQRRREEAEKQAQARLEATRPIFQEVREAAAARDQQRVKAAVQRHGRALAEAKPWLSDAPEWKQYQENLLAAGFTPEKWGKGHWGQPKWGAKERLAAISRG